MFLVAINAGVLVPVAGAVNFKKIVMPGDTIAVHAKYEEDCNNCHEPLNKQSQRNRCLLCHKVVAADIKKGEGYHGHSKRAGEIECKWCHTDHKGRNLDVVNLDKEVFDHRLTGFSDKGRHLEAGCDECHAPRKKYRDAPRKCFDCHKKVDRHAGAQGNDCGRCHTETGWKTVTFQHDKSKFPLRGKHKIASCWSCHAGERFNVHLTGSCYGCHVLDDSHEGRFGEKCDKCHKEESWKHAIFRHESTKFPLHDKHAEAKCQRCHRKPVSEQKLKPECFNCHEQTDVRHTGKFGKKCDSCHSTKGWTTRLFDHNSTKFPLKGNHAKVKSCLFCHKGGLDEQKRLPVLGCVGCHKNDDRHKSRFGEKCIGCHSPEEGWSRALRHDHATTKFPLKEKHVEVACNSCHSASSGTLKVSTECVACHRYAEPHDGRYGLKCEGCHTAREWKSVVFDHRKSRFPLDEKHAKAKCDDCHKSFPSARNQGTECGSCHLDIHNKRYGAKCDSCHKTKAWKEYSFDHAKTEFPLTGKHESKDISCYRCHWDPVDAKRLGPNCYKCHEKNYPHGGSVSTQCETCHTAGGWVRNVEFDHLKATGISLIGPHNLVPCEVCHLSRIFSEAKTDCKSCHGETNPLLTINKERGSIVTRFGELVDGGVERVKEAAQTNDPKAQYRLGSLYRLGFGVPKDVVLAFTWMRKSAENGDPRAQYSLGCMYDRGIGVAPNPSESARWFATAFANGDRMAVIRAKSGTHGNNAPDNGSPPPSSSSLPPDVATFTDLLKNAKKDGGMESIRDLCAGISMQGQQKKQDTPEAKMSTAGQDPGDWSREGALRWAARVGKTEMVLKHLADGANIDEPDAFGRTALMEAVSNGRDAVVRELLGKGADPNKTDLRGDNPINLAAERRSPSLVEMLAAAGAWVDPKDANGLTPLLLAVKRNDVPTVLALLENRADLNVVDHRGRTAVQYAAAREWKPLVDILVGVGAELVPEIIATEIPKQADVVSAVPAKAVPGFLNQAKGPYNGWSTLMLASWRGQSDAVSALLSHKTELEWKDKQGFTALGRAAWEGRTAVVTALLAAGAKPNAPQEEGKTPLMLAAGNGHAGVARLLISAGARVETKQGHGMVALHYAAKENQLPMAELLMAAGADPKAMTNTGQTPLLFAVSSGFTEMSKRLLARGSDPNSRDTRGRTPLAIAADEGRTDIVRLLLSSRADVSATDREGHTPLSRAAWRGQSAVVTVLLSAGAKVAHATAGGNTPLMLAASQGYVDIVRALLNAGADPNSRNRHGNTALMLAVSGWHSDAARVLVEHRADTGLKNNKGEDAEALASGNEPIRALILKSR